MSKVIAIALILILLIILFYTSKVLAASLKHVIEHLPRVLFVVLAIVVIVAIAYLVKYLLASTGMIPATGEITASTELETIPEKAQQKDLIFLQQDILYIGGKEVSDEELDAYIKEHVEGAKEVIIVDDYSSSEKMHAVVSLCKEKGANVRIEDETWLEQE